MRKTSKILVLVLVLSMLFAMTSMFTASAAQPEKLYLTPNANWKKDNARFAAYFFGNGDTWVSMTDSDKDGVYEVAVPTDKKYPNVIFCRMKPDAAANNWDNKWNQTADLEIPTTGPNHYTVAEGTWDSGGGTWSTFNSTCLHTNLGPAATCTTAQVCNDCGDPVVSALGHNYDEAHKCSACQEQATFTVAGNGAHLVEEWATGCTANDMTYADGVYTKVYENVAAGSYELKCLRDHAWGTSYGKPNTADNYTYEVTTAGSTVTVTLTGTTVDVKVEAPHTHDFVEGKCECGEVDPDYVAPHVNKLVVGETNKIVVDGSQTNAYNLPVAWVEFAVEEAARYTFLCAEEGALALIYVTDGTVYDYYGVSANLAPGTYWVCVGGGTTGDFNVTVYQTPSQNTAITASPLFPCFYNILVEGELSNGLGPVVWVEFTVTQEAHYKFDYDKAPALIYTSNADFMDFTTYKGAEADLTPGTYYVLVGGTGDTGYFNLSVTQTAIEQGGDVPDDLTHGEQEFVLGENTVIIDGCTDNLMGTAVEMVKFVVTERAKYTFTSTEISTYIATQSNPKEYPGGYLGGTLTNEGILEPGTYYICCGKNDARGTFTVTVTMTEIDENCEHEWTPANCTNPATCSKCGAQEGEPNSNVHAPYADTCGLCGKDVPSFVVGNNHVNYVPGMPSLLPNGDLYVKVEITEPGTYVISGGAAAKVKVYMWSVPTHKLEGGQLTTQTPFAWNVNAMNDSGFADSFEIVLEEAGVYWIGFKYDMVSEAVEYDIDISLKVEEPQPEPELNFFQKIIAWFMDLIQKILGFFKK